MRVSFGTCVGWRIRDELDHDAEEIGAARVVSQKSPGAVVIDLVLTELVGTSQKQNYDVSELIREVTRAAEAVRALATYLSENPDALLKGRSK